MIVLVQIVLPSPLLIVPGQQLEPLTYEGEALEDAKKTQALAGVDTVEVRVLSPYRSQRPSDAASGLGPGDPDLLNPADPQPVEANIEVDGKAVIRCDAHRGQHRGPGLRV